MAKLYVSLTPEEVRASMLSRWSSGASCAATTIRNSMM